MYVKGGHPVVYKLKLNQLQMALQDRCNQLLLRLEAIISEQAVLSNGKHNTSFRPALLGASVFNKGGRTFDYASSSDEEYENPVQTTDNVPWNVMDQLVPIMCTVAKAKYGHEDLEVMHHIWDGESNRYVNSNNDDVSPMEGECYIRLWDPTSPQNNGRGNVELHLEVIEVIDYHWLDLKQRLLDLADCEVYNGNIATFSFNASNGSSELFTITQEAEGTGFLELPVSRYYKQDGKKKRFGSMKELETMITEIIENQKRIEEMDKKEIERRKQELLQRMIHEGT